MYVITKEQRQELFDRIIELETEKAMLRDALEQIKNLNIEDPRDEYPLVANAIASNALEGRP